MDKTWEFSHVSLKCSKIYNRLLGVIPCVVYLNNTNAQTQNQQVYFGVNCLCVALDLMNCDQKPCANNGVCTDGTSPGEYTCTCAEGYTGVHCKSQTGECDPNPCQNNAMCDDGHLSYTCECTTGFSGTSCEETGEYLVQARQWPVLKP